MKTNKVLSDLRALIDDIENKRVDIESYSYFFDYTPKAGNEGMPTDGNEWINIEFSSRSDMG